jgi:hypothetical protein
VHFAGRPLGSTELVERRQACFGITIVMALIMGRFSTEFSKCTAGLSLAFAMRTIVLALFLFTDSIWSFEKSQIVYAAEFVLVGELTHYRFKRSSRRVEISASIRVERVLFGQGTVGSIIKYEFSCPVKRCSVPDFEEQFRVHTRGRGLWFLRRGKKQSWHPPLPEDVGFRPLSDIEYTINTLEVRRRQGRN